MLIITTAYNTYKGHPAQLHAKKNGKYDDRYNNKLPGTRVRPFVSRLFVSNN